MIKNEVELSPLVRDLVNHDEGDAAEDIRLALNGIIAKYKLHPSRVISLLARASAGYIHLTQKIYDEAGADEVVEEDFQNMLTAHLTDLDMSECIEMSIIVILGLIDLILGGDLIKMGGKM